MLSKERIIYVRFVGESRLLRKADSLTQKLIMSIHYTHQELITPIICAAYALSVIEL
jgi:hypothetical protein